MGPGARGRRVAFTLVVFAVAACLTSGSAGAASLDDVQITTTPALYPAFTAEVTDYVTRCDGSTPVDVSVTAPAGTTVSVDHGTAATGTFTAPVPLAEGESFTVAVATAPAPAQLYTVRCLPQDFPAFTSKRFGTTQAEWYVVTPTIGFGAPPPGTDIRYSAIFDGYGVPVWWYRSITRPLDAKILPNGNVAWVNFVPTINGAPTGAEERTLDGSLVRMVDTAGSGADHHDIQLLPNGNYLLGRYFTRTGVDLSSCGGSANGDLEDNEVQELTPDGTLVWSWSAYDHIPLSEVASEWVGLCAGGGPADLYHWNSIEDDGDGVILSFRHLDAVYRVDKATGAVTWKLGGTPRPESLAVVGDAVFGAGGSFSGQHDARVLPDGTLTVHDNGTGPGRPPRAVRYAIDTNAATATLLEEITDASAPTALCCGSSRKLEGGNWVAAWGANLVVTELTPTGARVFRLTFTQNLFTYRANPVEFGVVGREALRLGMDLQAPRGAPAGVGLAAPSTVLVGDDTLLTVTVTPAQNPTSTGLTVVADLGSIGGSDTQAFFDDGTNGDVTAGDKVFSYLSAPTVAGSTPLPVTVGDAQGRTASTSIALTVAEDVAPTVAATVPADGASNVAPDANVEVTFSEPVTVTGAWFGIQCSASGGHSATVTGGPLEYTLDPASDFAPTETCTVTVTAANVADHDGAADSMAGDYEFDFLVGSGPTAVEVRTFAAVRTGQRIVLRWTVGSTARVLGFHVYRERAGRRVRLDRALVAARGARTFVWRGKTSRAAARYWLEVVRLDGSRAWHGPARSR